MRFLKECQAKYGIDELTLSGIRLEDLASHLAKELGISAYDNTDSAAENIPAASIQPAGKHRGRATDTRSHSPKPPSVNDLTSTAWKLLRAARDMGADASENAVTRKAIAAKAKCGNPGSLHNKQAFTQLSQLGLITAKRNVGTWITVAGIGLPHQAGELQ
jgi:hypothetical protein